MKYSKVPTRDELIRFINKKHKKQGGRSTYKGHEYEN